MPPDLTVVIPTYNRAPSLDALLASLAAQRDADEFDVVVVDDGSADDTPEVAARWADGPFELAYLRPGHRGPAGARNEGLRHARGELVLFVDDDERADPGLLAAHRAAHAAHPGPHQGVVGLVDWAPEVRRTRFIRWLDRSGLQFAYVHMRPGLISPGYGAFYSANLSLKPAFLRERGLEFDERFPYAAFEDSVLGWQLERAGFELHYHPEALALHARQFTLDEFAVRMERVGESARIVTAAYPEFPLDEAFFLRGPSGGKARLLRAAAPVMRRMGPDRYADRVFEDRAARAYLAGRARSRAAGALQPS
ncbi:MAG: glycosyltransferase family 2 protein [Actinobacteria bacterium]|nr:glycosyltransferase family 2 protein [Actinomycetota bacterium]